MVDSPCLGSVLSTLCTVAGCFLEITCFPGQSHTCPYPYQQNAPESSACSAVPAHHGSLWFPEFFHIPTAPRDCTIIWAHADGREDRNDRAAAPPAGGGRDAGKGRMHGGCRQILRSLDCHALEAGLGLVCSEEISQALKQKDMVRSDRMVRTCLGSVKGKLEQREGLRRGGGAGGVTEMQVRGHDTGQQREELKKSTDR